MPKPPRSIAELLAQDKRYRREAYGFVFEALRYAHEVMGMGSTVPSEVAEGEAEEQSEQGGAAQRHLTGQQLCLAIQQYAMQQYGYMAKCVLNSWGVHGTGDFGEIVFNLISVGEMRKTRNDRREDFDNVFDFETDLQGKFQIERPE